MLITAVILFAIAAVVGVIMAIAVMRGQAVPRMDHAVLHGLAAATALVLLLVAVIQAGAGGGLGLALGLFIVAAIGGFALLTHHLRDRPLPKWLVGGHGLIAVAGFLVLLAGVFATGP